MKNGGAQIPAIQHIKNGLPRRFAPRNDTQFRCVKEQRDVEDAVPYIASQSFFARKRRKNYQSVFPTRLRRSENTPQRTCLCDAERKTVETDMKTPDAGFACVRRRNGVRKNNHPEAARTLSVGEEKGGSGCGAGRRRHSLRRAA